MTDKRARRVAAVLMLLAALTALGALPAAAADPPSGFSTTTIGGFSGPTAMALAPDGRFFVTQQSGALRVVKNGAVLANPFVQLTVDSSGERGLLGVALDPNFPTNGFVYVYYTVPGTSSHNRVSRFTASGDVASPGETILLDLNNLSSATNHNGGAIHFGPDGKLYIAVGDNANSAQAQQLNQPFGKILRINSNGTVPNDNPFVDGGGSNYDAIWAYGLRNPFTFTFQPGTGRLFANDVGQSTWEEIDDIVKGGNFGWPVREGFCALGSTTDCGPPPSGMLNPVSAYGHDQGCAIVGGAFYDVPGNASEPFPSSYDGDYFFSDLCGGWLRTAFGPNYSVVRAFTDPDSSLNPVDILVAPDGSLWYLSRGSNALVHVRYIAPSWKPAKLVRADGVLRSGPAATAVRGNDRIDTFVRGTDGGVYWTSIQAANAGPWTPLGSPPVGVVGEPSAVSWAPGRLDVFVRGADNRVWQRFSTNGGASWSPWIQPFPDGVLASNPAAVAWSANRLDLMVTGTDGQIWQRFWNGSSWNSSWLPQGRPPTGSVQGAPAVASWAAGRLDLFVRGADDQLWQTFWNGSAWSGWAQPPGSGFTALRSSPAATSYGVNELSVFALGQDSGVYVTSFINGPTWTVWQRIGAPNDSGVGVPAATSRGPGTLDVFVRGSDDRLYRYTSP